VRVLQVRDRAQADRPEREQDREPEQRARQPRVAERRAVLHVSLRSGARGAGAAAPIVSTT
jgi:hypothetical protein